MLWFISNNFTREISGIEGKKNLLALGYISSDSLLLHDVFCIIQEENSLWHNDKYIIMTST